MKRYTYNIIKITLQIFFPELRKLTNENLGQIFSKIHKLLKHNGTLFTVKYIKQCRLHVTRYICGKPIYVSPLKISLVDGFPKLFLALKPLIDSGSVMNIKYSLTILNLSKVLWPRKDEKIPVDTSSITDESTAIWLPSNEVLSRVINLMQLQDPKLEFSEKQIRIITKAGPHGPQLMSWPETMKLFPFSIWKSLFLIKDTNYWNWLKDLMARGLKPSKTMSNPQGIDLDLPSFKEGLKHLFCRKLSVVKDPECKMRVIAIFDYITQTTLQPLHDSLFHILKNIPEDRTFTQNPMFHVKVDPKQQFWSLDLSSATDRFPIKLQTQILSLLRGKDFAEAWEGLMVSAPFKHPQTDEALYYKAGQPMGAKSSWAVFTLCHHIIIRYCAYIVGLHDFHNYIVLGDDVVINNDRVASKYKDVMSKLGVDISDSKTHVSYKTYEFAKRWITPNGEITPIPIRGIVEHCHNKFILMNILFDYFFIKGNGYYARTSLLFSLSELCYLLSKIISSNIQNSKKNSKRNIPKEFKYISRKKIRDIMLPYYFLLRYNFGICSYDEIRKYFAMWTNKQDLYPLPNEKVVRSETERILSLAVIGVAFSTLNKTRDLYDRIISINKDDLFYEGKEMPLFTSIYLNISSIAEMAMTWNTRNIDLNKAIDALIMLDIDSITSRKRRKLVEFQMFGSISQRFRSEMRFGADQIISPARSLNIIKVAKDLQVNLLKFRKSQTMLAQAEPTVG
nr:RNA-dependent RNA polymerase [Phomopsis viticola mitovirus 962_1]